MTARRVCARLLAAVALACPGICAFAADAAPHWSYAGHGGPAHWASLEPEFASCKIGQARSPIDIRTHAVKPAPLPAIEFAYKPGTAKIIDNGHTIQVTPAVGNSISVDGHRYELVQFHFHKPSEESIDGKRREMVAHLVHKDESGKLAAVAVLLHSGRANPIVAALWKNLPSPKDSEVEVKGAQIDAAALLSPRTRLLHVRGLADDAAVQ